MMKTECVRRLTKWASYLQGHQPEQANVGQDQHFDLRGVWASIFYRKTPLDVCPRMHYNIDMRKKLGPWMMTDDNCGAYRAYAGLDGENLANRVAFIEKTPKVRIREYNMACRAEYDDLGNFIGENRQWEDFLNWMERDWKGDGPKDEESREWCDRVLVALEYELEN